MIIRSSPVSAFRSNGLIKSVYQPSVHQLPVTAKLFLPCRHFSRVQIARAAVVAGGGSAHRLRDGYFSTSNLLGVSRGLGGKRELADGGIGAQIEMRRTEPNTIETPTTQSQPQTEELPPHRRRKAARQAAQQPDLVLPENSSTTLSESASHHPASSLRRRLPVLLSLSKPRLSVLVVLTAMASYSLYPVPELLSPSSLSTPSLSPLTLLFLTTGTALSAASANAFNMLYELKWDAMMSRTKNRPLVRGLISPRGAALFAIVSGLVGVGALYYGVNPTVSFLGATNIFLYAGVYTPLKRISVINTWVGALVGGFPPLMGWAAAAGQTATTPGDAEWKELLLGEKNIGGWLLASLLVAWQFPHFMSLSWSIRHEYKNAGYKMLAWTNPARNGRVALRYSLAMFPVCIGLSYVGVTEWVFAGMSTPVNMWLTREAWRFWRLEGAKGSARGLFWASVWHLPVLLMLAMVEKKGLWGRVGNALGFWGAEEDEEWEDDDN